MFLNRPFYKILQIKTNLNCNLKCKNCSFHGQYINELNEYNLELLENDCSIISNCGYFEDIQIVGGEPLLNEKLKDFVLIVKKFFNSSNIILFTNGVLLKKININILKMFNRLLITKYHYSNLDYKDLKLYLDDNLGLYKTHFLDYPEHKNFDTFYNNKNKIVKCKNNTNYTMYNSYFYYCQRPLTSDFVQKNIFNREVKENCFINDGIKIDSNLNSIKLFKYIYSKKALNACLYCNNRVYKK